IPACARPNDFSRVIRTSPSIGHTLACDAMTQRSAFDKILETRLSRRTVLASGAAVGLAACSHTSAPSAASSPASGNSFKSIEPQDVDKFVIADGYRYNVVARWGDSLFTGTPDFDSRR